VELQEVHRHEARQRRASAQQQRPGRNAPGPDIGTTGHAQGDERAAKIGSK
jgi:hypothetical protein